MLQAVLQSSQHTGVLCSRTLESDKEKLPVIYEQYSGAMVYVWEAWPRGSHGVSVV